MNPGKLLRDLKDKITELRGSDKETPRPNNHPEPSAVDPIDEAKSDESLERDEPDTARDNHAAQENSDEVIAPRAPEYPDSAEELEESTLVEERSDGLLPVPEESAFKVVEEIQDIQAQHEAPKELLDPNAPELNEPITSDEADKETDAIFSDLIKMEGGSDTHIEDADEMVSAINEYNEGVKNSTFSLEDADGLNDDGSLVK